MITDELIKKMALVKTDKEVGISFAFSIPVYTFRDLYIFGGEVDGTPDYSNRAILWKDDTKRYTRITLEFLKGLDNDTIYKQINKYLSDKDHSQELIYTP